jgi:hypothetical protein
VNIFALIDAAARNFKADNGIARFDRDQICDFGIGEVRNSDPGAGSFESGWFLPIASGTPLGYSVSLMDAAWANRRNNSKSYMGSPEHNKSSRA